MKTRGLMRGVTLAALVLLAGTGGGRMATSAEVVGERPLLDNDKVTVIEYRFPAGFQGEEHAAFANEFAYVLDGAFTVTTKGHGRRVVRRGEIEYASQGTIHASSNEGKTPAVVLVVILKGR
jgi:quercetin dioxygenase-like cupin family protein